MELEKRARIWSSIVTAIFCFLLLLVLLLVCLEQVKQEQEDGVPMALGDPDAGSNDMFEPTPESEVQEVAQQAPQTPAPAQPAPAVAPKVVTQDLEQTAVTPTAKKKQEKPSTASNAAEEEAKKQKEQQRQQELLAQRQKQAEELARKKAEAEAAAKKKAEQEAIAKKAQSMANVFKKNSANGNGSDPTSNGTGSGSKAGNNGSANGSSGGGQGGRGNTWSLAGRQIMGTLPRPAYNANEEGYIIVNIEVDNDGNVTTAEISKVFGITAPSIRSAALAAAKKAKFSKKDGGHINQRGSITYVFKLQ